MAIPPRIRDGFSRVMNQQPRILAFLLTFAAFAGYWGGLGLAATYSLKSTPTPGEMPAVATYIVSTVNAIFIANLGALLGVKAVLHSSHTFTAGNWLQLSVAVLHVVTLILVGVVWGATGFTEDPDQIVPVIVDVCRSALGVIIAGFGAALGISAARR